MARQIHKQAPMEPSMQVKMQLTASIYLNMFYKRMIDKEYRELTPRELSINLFIKTRALIAYDRIAIYGAIGD